MRLVLVEGRGIACYSSAQTGRGWRPGEVREVTEAVAAYLTSTFPGAFVEQRDPKPAQRAATTMPPEDVPRKPHRRGR